MNNSTNTHLRGPAEFEKDAAPIFVAYGLDPHFEEVIHNFHIRFDTSEEDLYLSLNMGKAKCDTQEDTIFEIIHQLAELCIPKISNAKDADALLKQLPAFRKAHREKGDNQPENQLWRFASFAEFVVYPPLQELFRTKHRNIIGFVGFEEVAEWSTAIYKFILDSLLRHITGVKLRFVIFVRSDKRPMLNFFYGSNQEDARAKISFCPFVNDTGEDGGYMNYL